MLLVGRGDSDGPDGLLTDSAVLYIHRSIRTNYIPSQPLY